MKKLVMVLFSVVLSFSALAEKPILIVGASYANATLPFNDNLEAIFGGISVGFGSYLSLGDALVRERRLSGLVVNEAQAGATTFDRMVCNPFCVPGLEWQGFDKQLTKALARITVFDSASGQVSYNGKYVIFSGSNDCIHSDAFGIPMQDTSPCTLQQINEHTDRLIAVGQRVLDLGLVPVFIDAPLYDNLDLPKFGQLFGMVWVASKVQYEQLDQIRRSRIDNELPGAVRLNVWRGFNEMGDGIHPDRATVERAAGRIACFIKRNEVNGQNEACGTDEQD